MSLIHKDGFDYWADVGYPFVNSDYTLSSGVATSSNNSQLGGAPIYGTGRFLVLTQNGLSLTKSFTSGSTFIMGFHFRLKGNDQAHTFLQFDDSGTNQLKFVINTSLHIEVYKNTTLLGTSSSPITLDVWDFLEFKFTINSSTGTVEIRKNESPILSLTGQNTQNTGNATVNSFKLNAAPGNYQGRELGIDNLYLLDNTGSKLNNYLGEVRIVINYPNAAGTTTSWTPLSGTNFSNVSGLYDQDNSYVETSTSGNIDLYNLAAFGASGTIHSFAVINISKRTDITPINIRNVIRRSGTNYESADHALTPFYLFYKDEYTEDPSTAIDWTASGIDAAEIGIKLS